MLPPSLLVRGRAGLVLVLALSPVPGCERNPDQMWRAASERARDPEAVAALKAQEEEDRVSEEGARAGAAVEKEPHAEVRDQLMLGLRAIAEAKRAFDEDKANAEIEALTKLPKQAVGRPLLDLLATNPDGLGAPAALVMGALADPGYAAPLVRALKGRDVWVAESAAQALAKFDNPVVTSSLVEAAGQEGRTIVRVAAIGSLGRMGNKGVVPPLLEALSDAESEVCGAAAVALGRLGDDRARQPMLSLLAAKPEPVTQLALAQGLSKLGAPEALPAFARLLTMGSQDVRKRSLEALKKREDRREVIQAALDVFETEPGLALDLIPRIHRLCDASCSRQIKLRIKRAKSPPAKNALKLLLDGLPASP